MFRYLAVTAIVLGAPMIASEAKAQSTVECQSRHFQVVGQFEIQPSNGRC